MRLSLTVTAQVHCGGGRSFHRDATCGRHGERRQHGHLRGGVDGSGPFTFAWRKDGVAIPGATSAVLTLSSVSGSSAGNYSVAVSNAVAANVVSSAAALTVLPNGASVPPTITTQPSTIVIAPGGSGTLAVAAAGSGPLSYQWRVDGVPMAGETSPVWCSPTSMRMPRAATR